MSQAFCCLGLMRGQYVNVRGWGLSPFSLLAAEVAARFGEGGWELAVPLALLPVGLSLGMFPHCLHCRGGGTSVRMYRVGCGMSGAG